jgi:hypothetical protein
MAPGAQEVLPRGCAMCDGYVDQTTWTIRVRATGEPLRTAEGYTFSFTDEVSARAFLDGRADAANLEIARVEAPVLS